MAVIPVMSLYMKESESERMSIIPSGDETDVALKEYFASITDTG